MAYDTSITTFTPKVDDVDDVMAADINAAYTEISAIETALGTAIKGNQADLKTRLLQSVNADGNLDFASATQLTISGGAIVPTQNFHKIETEAGAASDNLDNVTATNATEGFMLIIRPTTINHVVVIRHSTGNIRCVGGVNISLTQTYSMAILVYDAVNAVWMCMTGNVTGSGTGNVVGPTSVTADHVATYDGTTGKLLKDGGVMGNVVAPASAVTDGDLVLFDGTDGKLLKSGGAPGGGGGYTQGASITLSGAINTTQSAGIAVAFDTAIFDTDGMFDVGTPGRITCITAGTYSIIANLALMTAETILVQLTQFDSVGGTIQTAAYHGSEQDIFIPMIWKLSIGDYITVFFEDDTDDNEIYQSSNLTAQRIA